VVASPRAERGAPVVVGLIKSRMPRSWLPAVWRGAELGAVSSVVRSRGRLLLARR
jgi:hypothetical protein